MPLNKKFITGLFILVFLVACIRDQSSQQPSFSTTSPPNLITNNGLAPKEVDTFTDGIIPIWAIQGESDQSPYLFQEVTTTGIVIGIFPKLEGFWIQGEDDQNDLTSNGLFIYSPKIDPSLNLGDLVQVEGVIHEPETETQLFLKDLKILAPKQPLPDAIALNPPGDRRASEIYFESLEGMLVTVDGPARVVAPTDKYGETVVVLPSFKGSHLLQGSDIGMGIRVDDGKSSTYKNQKGMPFAAVTGDYLDNILGPLAYTYGFYKIEPIEKPLLDRRPIVVDALPETEANEFRVMTWNVENLFDDKVPFPSDTPIPTESEYRIWLEKIARTILLADFPAVIALQEVENIDVLEDLAENPILDKYRYQAVLVEGSDRRGIDVGYLVRGDVKVSNVQQFPAPDGLTPRPPLLLEVQIKLQTKTKSIYVLNNHFQSMGAGELESQPRRVAQAEWNVKLFKKILAKDPEAFVIILGDLNSYFDSPPIDVLRNNGLVHVFDQLSPDERYTYIYQGIAQVLDHILISGGHANEISRVDILHVNSDYPLQLPNDTSVFHKSDHDPVVVTFSGGK